ncbi:PadR family transcriptional regulator [Streptomyces sp. MBT62]|uniref:PadR family transcriptional regulator n=1 Tax=Streptomyces sp. MBT62 TaxID=2800410 RepID=UPI00190D5EFF|nr:helix-turn-helix transcriptional regulator [Streptomyces sp. MBT62]MBK3564535.1 helix-turn-helix transcriptional regulator [Streptomyces sp. MBT62]
MDQKYLTPAVVRMLQEFLKDPDHTFYATELMEASRVSSGSFYPGITRLQRAGWVISEDEDIDPRAEGRPARVFYRMTGEGARAAHLALVELSNSVRPPASSPGWLFGPEPKGI